MFEQNLNFGTELRKIPREIVNIVDNTYELLAGEPFPIGSRYVSEKLLAEGLADYTLCSTSQAVRLGVLRYFALMALFNRADGIGAILSKFESNMALYEMDRYGVNGISAREFLDKFRLKFFGRTALETKDMLGGQGEWEYSSKGIVFSCVRKAHLVTDGLKRRATLSVIEDDGATIRVTPIDRVRSSNYRPFMNY
jgi:hypothetical protein